MKKNRGYNRSPRLLTECKYHDEIVSLFQTRDVRLTASDVGKMIGISRNYASSLLCWFVDRGKLMSYPRWTGERGRPRTVYMLKTIVNEFVTDHFSA